MYHLFGPGKSVYHAYSAGGERAMTFDGLTGQSTFRIRDLSGKVVREFHFNGAGTWKWKKDWIHRGSGGPLLGFADDTGQTRWAHSDHLGTPRVFSDPFGIGRERRHYYAFGEQAVSTTALAEIDMAFTGHERDFFGAGTVDDLDYMHQRYYSPQMSRFLSVDPIGGIPEIPASWNRYAYVMNVPTRYVDPFGLALPDPQYSTQMLPFTWDPKTDEKIEDLHPCLQLPAAQFINAAESSLNLQLRIAQGYRSIAEQNALYAQGRGGNPGPRVTNARGGQSYHNYGLAFDVAPIVNGQLNYGISWSPLGQLGDTLGLEWGGRWKNPDRPHFQLTLGQSTSQLQAMSTATLGNLPCP